MSWLESPSWLPLAANVASVLGLIITVGVWMDVRRIKSFYLFKGRVPQITKKLNERASNISRLLADFTGSRHSIEIELAESVVLLRSLASKSGGQSKAAAKHLIRKIEQTGVQSPTHVRQVYVDMRTLLLMYQEIQSDQEWEL